MIFSVSTGFFHERPLDELLPLVREAGFASVELMVNREVMRTSSSDLLEIFQRHGIRCASLHAPFERFYAGEWADERTTFLKLLDLATALGAGYAITHPPVRGDRLDEYSGNLGGRGAADGPRLTTENLGRYGDDRLCKLSQDPKKLLKFLEESRHPVCFDSSHVGTWTRDPVEEFMLLREHVVAIHLSDSRGATSHIVPGRGDLDLDRFLRAVKKAGYDGIITLEVDLESGRKNPAGSDSQAVEWLDASRRMMEAALS
jgi:sugar phosphate isomerase/epimerase